MARQSTRRPTPVLEEVTLPRRLTSRCTMRRSTPTAKLRGNRVSTAGTPAAWRLGPLGAAAALHAVRARVWPEGASSQRVDRPRPRAAGAPSAARAPASTERVGHPAGAASRHAERPRTAARTSASAPWVARHTSASRTSASATAPATAAARTVVGRVCRRAFELAPPAPKAATAAPASAWPTRACSRCAARLALRARRPKRAAATRAPAPPATARRRNRSGV